MRSPGVTEPSVCIDVFVNSDCRILFQLLYFSEFIFGRYALYRFHHYCYSVRFI